MLKGFLSYSKKPFLRRKKTEYSSVLGPIATNAMAAL
jgi:hypothetical protein